MIKKHFKIIDGDLDFVEQELNEYSENNSVIIQGFNTDSESFSVLVEIFPNTIQDKPFKIKSIDFIDWINNNWFIPSSNGMWKLDKAHPEYTDTIDFASKVDIWTSEELYELFTGGMGEF